MAEHEHRASLDLGNGRDRPDRRRGGRPNPGTAWKAVGTGDFNHDGFADILWQNTSTGQASVWEMDGNTKTGGGAVSANPGPAWTAVGTGDFNKDGNSDILWQNKNTGQVSIWEMDGNAKIGGGTVTPNPGTAWKAVGTGDFNHDGFADILFQNASTGQVSIWEMEENTKIGGGAVAPIPAPSWHAIGSAAAAPTSCFRTRAAKPRSGTWTGPPGSAPGRSAPIRGRPGTPSG